MFLFSIIVLTKNSEQYIDRCLNSLCQQNRQDIEVLILDGDSADKTIKICKSFSRKIQIKIIAVGTKTMGEARNIGIKKAQGEYIAFCDSDDFFGKKKLLTYLKEFKKDKTLDVCYGDTVHFTGLKPNINCIQKKSLNKIQNIKNCLFFSQKINLSTVIIHKRVKSVLFPIGQAGKYGEDWQYLMSLAFNNCKFGYVSGRHSYIEKRKNSHTTWGIQNLMKYYTLAHLLKNQERIIESGLSLCEYNKSVRVNRNKLVFACIAAGGEKYNVKNLNMIVQSQKIKLPYVCLVRFFASSKIMPYIIRTIWQIYYILSNVSFSVSFSMKRKGVFNGF